MAGSAGSAYLSVKPSLVGFQSDLSRGVATAGTKSAGVFNSRLKSALKIGGIVAAGAAIAFTKSAISLEAEFSKTMNVLKATSDVPKKGMRDLNAMAIKMGQDTVFSANDAAKAMLELAKNGITPATIQAGALKSALTLAAAGGIDMETAATVMGNALNTFNLKGKDSSKVAAALAGAANASSASIGSLADGLQQVGTVAADSDQTVQETTAALAALSNAGITGSDAGTTLKTMFARLLPSTKAARTAFTSFGLAAYQSKGSMDELAELGIKPLTGKYADVHKAIGDYIVRTGQAERGTADFDKKTTDLLWSTGMIQNAFVKQNGEFKGMAQIAGVLEEKFGDLSSSERAAAFNTIFGSDARRAATVLTNEGSKGLAKYIVATSDKSAADKAAAAQMKGTAGAIEAMKGSVETASLAWGQAMKPVTMFGANLVATIANGAVPIIQDFGKILKSTLKDFDFSKVTQALKNIDIAAVFTRIKKSMAGIDWSALGKVDFSAFKDAGKSLPTFSDGLNVLGTVLRFASKHVDLLAKALPFLVAGFLAVKIAQASAQAAAVIALPVRIAELVIHRQLVRSNAQLVVAMNAATASSGVNTVAEKLNTTAKSSGIVASVRSRVVTIAKTVAEKAAAAASKALAVATWLVNAAMSANPIGIVVKVLGVLVGALALAYASSADFRRVVNGAWSSIKTVVAGAWTVVKRALSAFGDFLANDLGPIVSKFYSNTVKPVFASVSRAITSAWTNIVKPIFKAFGDFLADNLGPAIKWLWDKVVKPVFSGIGKTISAWWNNVVKPVFALLKGYFTNVLFPILELLWKGVVKPVFKYIGEAIKFWWNNIVKPVFGLLKAYFTNVLFPVLRFLWDKVVKPVFGGISKTISSVWNNGIKPVLQTFGGFIKDKVAPAFSRAVELIGNAWEKLKKLIGTPIYFVLETIINDKLIKGFNWLADQVGSKGIPRIPGTGSIPRFAKGGIYPGYTPGRDIGFAAVSGGEAIMRPEWARVIGDDRIDAMNAAARVGGVEGARKYMGAFASGGRVSMDGEPLDAVTAKQIRVAEGLSRQNIYVIQGSFQPHTSYSGSTHTGAGAADVSPVNSSIVKALQASGFAAWDRTGRGDWGPHIHAISRLASGVDSAARGQVQSYVSGSGDGLGGSAYGPRVPMLGNLSKLLGGNVTDGGYGTATNPGLAGLQRALFDPVAEFGAAAVAAIKDPTKFLKDKIAGPMSKLTGGPIVDIMKALPGRAISGLSDYIKDKLGGYLAGPSGTSGVAGLKGLSGAASITSGAGGIRAIVAKMAAARGWGDAANLNALNALISQESSWDPNAANPDSSARGLFQKMTSIHGPIESTVKGQTRWGLNYIASRHDNPVGAWGFHTRNNWYDDGGMVPPGLSLSYNGTGKAEHKAVFTDAQWATMRQMADRRGAGGTPRFELVLDNGEKIGGYMKQIAGHEFDSRSALDARRAGAFGA